MDFFAKGLGERGFRVARFEYPYMSDQRRTGKKSRRIESPCYARLA